MRISPASQRQVRVSMPDSRLARVWAQLYHDIKETHVVGCRTSLEPPSAVVLTTQDSCLAVSPFLTPPRLPFLCDLRINLEYMGSAEQGH